MPLFGFRRAFRSGPFGNIWEALRGITRMQTRTSRAAAGLPDINAQNVERAIAHASNRNPLTHSVKQMRDRAAQRIDDLRRNTLRYGIGIGAWAYGKYTNNYPSLWLSHYLIGHGETLDMPELVAAANLSFENAINANGRPVAFENEAFRMVGSMTFKIVDDPVRGKMVIGDDVYDWHPSQKSGKWQNMDNIPIPPKMVGFMNWLWPQSKGLIEAYPGRRSIQINDKFWYLLGGKEFTTHVEVPLNRLYGAPGVRRADILWELGRQGSPERTLRKIRNTPRDIRLAYKDFLRRNTNRIKRGQYLLRDTAYRIKRAHNSFWNRFTRRDVDRNI